jgi:hypothetical protein
LIIDLFICFLSRLPANSGWFTTRGPPKGTVMGFLVRVWRLWRRSGSLSHVTCVSSSLHGTTRVIGSPSRWSTF